MDLHVVPLYSRLCLQHRVFPRTPESSSVQASTSAYLGGSIPPTNPVHTSFAIMLFLALSPGRTDFATTKAVVDAELAAGAHRAASAAT